MCYELEFCEPLAVDESGVPLEHLLTCVSNVQLKYGGPNKNIKYIKREIRLGGENEEENVLRNIPPSLVANVNLFCRYAIFETSGFLIGSNIFWLEMETILKLEINF